MAKDWELDKNMGKDADLIEEKVSSEDVFDGNLLHVKKDTVRLPNGNIAYREWIKHPGASAVVPVTPEGRLIFVRQYRYPIQQVTLEIPAGKLDAEETLAPDAILAISLMRSPSDRERTSVDVWLSATCLLM